MPDFSKARVGDRVYDIRHGEGKITSVNNSGSNFPIACHFPETDEHETYDLDGKLVKWHIGPVLFHAKPEISDPPPPKRMIKRKAWLNINKLSKTDTAVYTHGTKEDADRYARRYRVACIPIEWEEEEE